MAVQLILTTDTLSAGFRVKANSNFNELIQSISIGLGTSGIPNGTYILNKNGGGSIVLNLGPQFYTKTQIAQLLAQISSSPYSGAWVSGFPLPAGTGYPSGSIVDNDGNLWRANTLTTTQPGTDPTWDNVFAPTVVDFPSGVSIDLDTLYAGDVTADGLEIYAEQYYTDLTIDPSGANIFIPYPLTYFKVSATNHIIFRKSNPADHIRITIKQ